MQLRIFSSDAACFFFSLLLLTGGLPKGGPLILIPRSLHQARFFVYDKSYLHEQILGSNQCSFYTILFVTLGSLIH